MHASNETPTNECATSWTENQRAHPPASGPLFCCPLCKAPYASILHSFQDNTFGQDWVVPRPRTSLPSLILTSEQRRRRSLYFQAPPRAPDGVKTHHTALVTSAEVQAWITRDLQAITLENDVKLLCEVTLGCLASMEQLDSGRRSASVSKLDHCSLTSDDKQVWLNQVASAVQPFIPDHAIRFAEQLLGFLASKLSIAGYDRLVFGEAARPTQAILQTSRGLQPSHATDRHASSSSSVPSHRSQGELSDTDCDAYMSLLHQQPPPSLLDHSGRSGPRQDGAVNPADDSIAASSSITRMAAVPVSKNTSTKRRSSRQVQGVHIVKHKRKHKRKKHKSKA